MKIAFIVSIFPALSETFILNQITGLISLGHEIDIFASVAPTEGKLHQDVISYKLIDRTHYFKIPNKRKDRIIKAVKILFNWLPRYPLILLKSLNILKYKSFYNCMNNLFFVEPFLGKEYDIIHCHFGPNGILGLSLRRLGVSAKIITTFHGYDITTVPLEKGFNYYGELLKDGDLFLPISNHWRDKIIAMGCNPEKIVVHRMGVNVEDFEFRTRRISCDGKVKLLTVARLVEKKGIQFAIEAMARVIAKYSCVEYRIIGDGPLRDSLQRLIQDLGVEKNIKLLGWMTQLEVRHAMEWAHIFILPSVTSRSGDQEGIPVALMEAQAVGLPVVSTWHSGIPELVVDGKSGFLVPERDVDALAERLQYLVEHPEVWPEMGRYGRDFVERYYDIRKLNQQLVNIYQNL